MKRRWRAAGVIVGMCLAGWLAPAAGAFTFTPAPGSPYDDPGLSLGVALGDFNGDGMDDFVAINGSPGIQFDGGNGAVYLADRDGGFDALGVTVLGFNSLAFGDFNGDGKLDVVENPNALAGPPGTTRPDIAVELGNGDGTFGNDIGSTVSLGCDVQQMVAGDFDADGRDDLAVLCTNDTVTVLLANGDGTFRVAPRSPFGLSSGIPGLIAVGRFTAGARADLIVTNDTQDTASILLSNGDGTFTPARDSPLAIGGQPSDLAVADFNHDGNEDVALDGVPAGDVTVLLGRGDGTFLPAAGSPIKLGVQGPGDQSFSVVSLIGAVDFNQDGVPDLAVGLPSGFDLLLGDGSGGFTLAHGSPFAQGSVLLAAGAFARPGVITGLEGNIRQMTPLFAAPPSQGPAAALSVAAKRVTAGQRVALDASGSSDPLDRALTDYRWDLGNGRFNHDTSTTPTLRASFPKAGTIHLRVRVTNAAGETGTATATLVVHPAPRTAVIAGALRVCIKARQRRCSTRAVRICRHHTRCVTADRVEAVAAHGKVVTIQKLKRGRFRLALVLGDYTIRLLADGNHTHRHVLQHRSVNARAHHTTHVRFSFRAPSGDGTAS
jgi:hypothetical protein